MLECKGNLEKKGECELIMSTDREATGDKEMMSKSSLPLI